MIATVSGEDTYGLFDLSNSLLNSKSFRIFLTKSTNILFSPESGEIYFSPIIGRNSFTESLSKIHINIFNKELPQTLIQSLAQDFTQSKNIWRLVVEKPPAKVPSLANGQVIRFGRQVIEVVAIAFQGMNFKNLSDVFQIETEARSRGQNLNSNLKLDKNLCRFCAEGEESSRPFLRNICVCSIEYPVHFDCLSEKVVQLCELKSERKIVYDFSLMNCEKCNERYPCSIKVNNSFQPTLRIKNPDWEFFLVLSVFEIEQSSISQLILLKLDKIENQTFTIGRNPTNDIQFTDASISREHAFLIWSNRQLFLYDNNSKYGTLMLLRGRVPIKEIHGDKLIIDRFMLQFFPRQKIKREPDVFVDPFTQSSMLVTEDLTFPMGFSSRKVPNSSNSKRILNPESSNIHVAENAPNTPVRNPVSKIQYLSPSAPQNSNGETKPQTIQNQNIQTQLLNNTNYLNESAVEQIKNNGLQSNPSHLVQTRL